jgi:hypothetical protein
MKSYIKERLGVYVHLIDSSIDVDIHRDVMQSNWMAGLGSPRKQRRDPVTGLAQLDHGKALNLTLWFGIFSFPEWLNHD